MNPDEITLVVPCYNVADTLPRVLSGIDALDPSPRRVLCVDDGSSDGTKAIIEAHDGVELVAHDTNRGLGATLNTGLAETETPGLAKIDADILVESDWLGKICTLRAEHGADLVQGRFEEQVTNRADKWRAKHPSPHFPDEPTVNDPVNGSNILCRTDALRNVGGWDEQFERCFDDLDLAERLINASHKVIYLPAIKTTHIRTDTWREALRTSWSYHRDLFTGEANPETAADVVSRFPLLMYRAGESVTMDLVAGDHDILWISLLRPFYHVKWDIESARQATN